jgi:uncharacterized membrane protein
MTTTTVIEHGVRIAQDDMIRMGSNFWREPIYGIPVPIFWNLFAVVIVALIFWWLIRSSSKHAGSPVDPPLNQLKRRYVAGEIDRKTYQQMKEDIAD